MRWAGHKDSSNVNLVSVGVSCVNTNPGGGAILGILASIATCVPWRTFMRNKSIRIWSPRAKKPVRESAIVEFDPMSPRMNSADVTICERRWREWWEGFLTIYLRQQGLDLHPRIDQLRKKHQESLRSLLKAGVSIRTVRRS